MSHNGNGNGHHDEEEQGEGAEGLPPMRKPDPLPEKFEPRCNICKSQYRKVIEKLALLPNTSYKSLGEQFGVDRRSIKKHMDEHLNYEEAAIQEIIADQAERLQLKADEGVKGVLARRVFLETYVHKATEALQRGWLELSAKDAIAAIQMAERFESQVGGAQAEEIQAQFNAFIQAFNELTQDDFDALTTPQELQTLIIERTKAIYAKNRGLDEEEQKQLEE